MGAHERDLAALRRVRGADGARDPRRRARAPLTAASLRRFCLAQPDAREEVPFGPETSVFKVGGKMFALAQLERRPLRVSVKCEPELGEQLRGTYEEIEPGYHLNKRHWLTVTCGGEAPDELVRELIAGSHDLVAA
ncbi:MAG TPA: MmcQ/YjbR family DNA-binding protein [Gaiellaceae bacterium]